MIEITNKSPIIIGCDHGGYRLKGFILEFLDSVSIPYTDIGCDSEEIVRYPHYASEVAHRIQSGEYTRGILICSTGIGMSLVANRYPGIRASAVTDHYTAAMTRQHNDSNVLCLGGKIIGEFVAVDILKAWLTNEYIGGRHDISLGLLKEVEQEVAGK
ncbi:MAG: ribose 5-phosphate isomerase B [Lawsonibacter sp.]|nr:ribose 5-phosphate isomerase B [Lawsonibacter sp.]